MDYIIDANGKKLGRVASEAAKILMGKDRVDFVRNAIPDIKVKIENVDKLNLTNKKMDTKKYVSYSGYPGGLKIRSMRKVVADKGLKEAMRIAVKGMLPKNKLRDKMMINLTITG